MTISCVMIVKNEENILARCLDSISDLMDEIVIVDTGSMDATKEIAARYTDKIYDFTWTGNFSDIHLSRRPAILSILQMRMRYWMKRII